MQIRGWVQNNFRGLAGGNVDILPSVKLFLPGIYDRKDFTIHVSFLLWTVGVHFYPRLPGRIHRIVGNWTRHSRQEARRHFTIN